MRKKPRSGSPKKGGRGQSQSSNVDHICQTMGRLLLRHEDAINRVRLDTGFALHVQTTAPILPALLKISKKWKGDKESGQLVLDLPLRTILVTSFFRELLGCVKQIGGMAAESEVFKTLVKEQIISQDLCFFKTQWIAKTQEVKNTAPSMTLSELVPRLEMMVTWLTAPGLFTGFIQQGRCQNNIRAKF